MRRVILLTLAVILLLSGRAASVLAQDSQPYNLETEIAIWRAIENSKNAPDYVAYLSAFPNGLLRELAVNRLTSLKPGTPPLEVGNGFPLSPEMMDQKKLLQFDSAFWDAIQTSTDFRDYNAYLRKFPDGLYSGAALKRRNALQP